MFAEWGVKSAFSWYDHSIWKSVALWSVGYFSVVLLNANSAQPVDFWGWDKYLGDNRNLINMSIDKNMFHEDLWDLFRNELDFLQCEMNIMIFFVQKLFTWNYNYFLDFLKQIWHFTSVSFLNLTWENFVTFCNNFGKTPRLHSDLNPPDPFWRVSFLTRIRNVRESQQRLSLLLADQLYVVRENKCDNRPAYLSAVALQSGLLSVCFLCHKTRNVNHTNETQLDFSTVSQSSLI